MAHKILLQGVIFMKANELSAIPQNTGLVNPGDKLTARVTDSGREVVTIEKNNGQDKITAVRYPSTDTIVMTKSQKKK